MIRDLAVAVSLANLWLLEVWFELLFMPTSSTYYLGGPRQPADYGAAIVVVALFTGFLFTGIRLARRAAPGTARFALDLLFLVGFLLPLNALRLNVRLPFGIGRLWHWLSLAGLQWVALLVVLAGILLLAYGHRLVAKAAFLLLLLLSPFAAFTLGRAAVQAAGISRAEAFPRPAVAAAHHPANPHEPRVLWLLFDELDESIIADKRPAGLLVPELDRLRSQSVQATNAFSPSDATLTSLPALLTGRMVTAAQPRGPAELAVTFAGTSEAVPWGLGPNVFCRAREAGSRTEVVGWYHPYCRELAACLDECAFEPVFLTVTGRDEQATFLDRVRDQALASLPINGRRLAVRSHLRTRDRALRAVSRDEPGLLFVHFPIPHVPPIFDRAASHLTLTRLSSVAGYLDNVALADRTLGEMRRAMEASGSWDRTTVLLTSDHHWRESRAFDGRTDRRVPFLVKMAGQREAILYRRELNTVVTGELVLSVLRQEVQTPRQVSDWLDRWRWKP